MTILANEQLVGGGSHQPVINVIIFHLHLDFPEIRGPTSLPKSYLLGVKSPPLTTLLNLWQAPLPPLVPWKLRRPEVNEPTSP